MLDQHAFQLEGADAVVGRLEHVVGAAHVGDVAVGVARGDVARVVRGVAHRFGGALGAVDVAVHQAQRPGRERQADLALVAGLPVHVHQHHLVAGQGPAHRSGLDRLARRVAHLRRRLGLAVAVAQVQAPGRAHAVDDLGVERLAGADHLAQLQPPAVGGQVFLDQHAPHGGRCAQRRDAVRGQHLQQRLRLEALVVGDEDAGARVPRREEAAPRVLGPARRGDVQVHVAGLQPQPVHGGQMPDRIALVRVQHQLGLGRGARGEIEQQRIGGLGHAVRREGVGVAVDRIGDAAGHGAADGDARAARAHLRELVRAARRRDRELHLPALHAVLHVLRRQQRGGRDHHGAELHGGQHDLPQRHLVAHHQQDAVPAAHTLRAQEVGGPVGARGHRAEGELALAAVLLDDPQRRGVVAGGQRVEPVEGPVEFVQLRPAEVAVGGGVVGAVRQQELAGAHEGGGISHACCLLPAACRAGFARIIAAPCPAREGGFPQTAPRARTGHLYRKRAAPRTMRAWRTLRSSRCCTRWSRPVRPWPSRCRGCWKPPASGSMPWASAWSRDWRPSAAGRCATCCWTGGPSSGWTIRSGCGPCSRFASSPWPSCARATSRRPSARCNGRTRWGWACSAPAARSSRWRCTCRGSSRC